MQSRRVMAPRPTHTTYDELAFPADYAAGQQTVKFVALSEIQSRFGTGEVTRAKSRSAQRRLLFLHCDPLVFLHCSHCLRD